MPRHCSVCVHPSRVEIDKALIGGTSLRVLATGFGLGVTALHRHKSRHLATALAKTACLVERAVEKEVTTRGVESLDVYREIGRCFDRVNKLFDACDAFLTDPSDPSKYTLMPRAWELEVAYTRKVQRGDRVVEVVEKALLSDLLAEARGESDRAVTEVRWKQADPRTLVLSTVKRLEGMQQWLTKLVVMTRDDAKVGAEAFTEEEAAEMRDVIVAALEDYPEARVKVAERLRKWLH